MNEISLDEYNKAISIVKEYLNQQVINLEKANNIARQAFKDASLVTNVCDMGFSTRAEKALLIAQCFTLLDIIKLGKNGIRKFRHIGAFTIKEISEKVEAYGYNLK